jgi:hypothetical protein
MSSVCGAARSPLHHRLLWQTLFDLFKWRALQKMALSHSYVTVIMEFLGEKSWIRYVASDRRTVNLGIPAASSSASSKLRCL